MPTVAHPGLDVLVLRCAQHDDRPATQSWARRGPVGEALAVTLRSVPARYRIASRPENIRRSEAGRGSRIELLDALALLTTVRGGTNAGQKHPTICFRQVV